MSSLKSQGIQGSLYFSHSTIRVCTFFLWGHLMVHGGGWSTSHYYPHSRHQVKENGERARELQSAPFRSLLFSLCYIGQNFVKCLFARKAEKYNFFNRYFMPQIKSNIFKEEGANGNGQLGVVVWSHCRPKA